METVNSYIEIKGDQFGHWVVRVVNGEVQIPDTAQRVTDTFEMLPGHIYRFYHMPDCRWYTDEIY